MTTSSKNELLGEELLGDKLLGGSLLNTLTRLVEDKFDVLERTLEQLERSSLAALQSSAPLPTSAVPVPFSSRDAMTAGLEQTDEEMQALMQKQQLVSIGLDKYARLRTEAADFVEDVDRLLSQLNSVGSLGEEELHEAAIQTGVASTSGEDAATTSAVAGADGLPSQSITQDPLTEVTSVTPVPPPLTPSLSSPKASTSLRPAHVTNGSKEQWAESTLENHFNSKNELNLIRTSYDTLRSFGGMIKISNRIKMTGDLVMQKSDWPVQLVTAACVEETSGSDGSRASGDRLFVGTQSGELLQLLGRSAFSLKTELQPVVGLAMLPDGVLLMLEATGRLRALVVDRSAVPATAKGPDRPVRIAREVCVSECLLPSGHQLVSSLSNMLVFTGLNTLLLPLKALPAAPDPSPEPSQPSPDNSGGQSDALSNTGTATANVDVGNGSIMICELLRTGLFSFPFGRHTIIQCCDSIACIAGHARSPLVAIGLMEFVILMSAESFEQMFIIHPTPYSNVDKHWTPDSVAIRTNALFVCATYGNKAVKEPSDADARLYCFPLGGPAHCVQRWSSTLSSPSNVLAIVNLPEVSSIEFVDSVVVYSFSKRLQSYFSQMQPTSSSSYSISSSDSTYADAGTQRQTHERQWHTVDVFNLQLFGSLPEIDIAPLWKNYEDMNCLSGLMRRAPTYLELEQLLSYMQTSTCVSLCVTLPPQPMIPVPISSSPSLQTSLLSSSSLELLSDAAEVASGANSRVRRSRSHDSQVLPSEDKKFSAAPSQGRNRNSHSESSIRAGAGDQEPAAYQKFASQVAHWFRQHLSRRQPQAASDTTRHSAVASVSAAESLSRCSTREKK